MPQFYFVGSDDYVLNSVFTRVFPRFRLVAVICFLLVVATTSPSRAQLPPIPAKPEATESTPTPASDETGSPGKVEVEPVATDSQIAGRLQRILDATDWFQDPTVRVEEGIAFLAGTTDSDTRKKWATDLARNTSDVVAVVNQIKIKTPSIWDLSPAVNSLLELWDGFIRTLPLILFGLIVIVLAYLAARGTTFVLKRGLNQHDSLSRLLREVVARAAGLGVFLLGLYLVLLVVGLARLAVTVLGGTGLIGLVIGIAFRDITENFLASVFLSIQRPFLTGDLIEVDDTLGLVQRLTIRTTILISLDGTLVQIPNSIIYKSHLKNYTSTPNRRESFVIGIGYEVAVPMAQEVAMEVLTNHPAVLADPEPWVLVDKLGSSSVELKIYFWLDGQKHSWLKVRSSVIRLIKRAFQKNDISIPDESREVIISHEVPLSIRLSGMNDEDEPAGAKKVLKAIQNNASTESQTDKDEKADKKTSAEKVVESDAVSTSAEGNLTNETETVEAQADKARITEQGDNLLQ